MVGSIGPSVPTTPATQGPAVPSRLHTAAVQFESLLLKELIAPLTKGGEDKGEEGGGGTLQSFGADAVAGSMAQSGALGFARQIERSLSQRTQKYSEKELKL